MSSFQPPPQQQHQQQRQDGHRLTTRQAASQAQRRAMNERRQILTQRIRKKKKSDWLSQKRGITTVGDHGGGTLSQPSSFTSTNTSTSIDLGRSIMEFVTNVSLSTSSTSTSTSPESLSSSFHQIQIALQSACLSAVPWTLDDTTRLEQAKRLIHRLGEILQLCVSTNNVQGAFQTMKTLVQVVSLSSCSSNSSSTTTDNNDYYYGRRVPTWSELLVQEQQQQQSRISSNLATLLTLPTQQQKSAPSSLVASAEHLQLIEQTCWFIGNWTQDFPSCSSHLVARKHDNNQNNLLPLLVSIMNLIRHQHHHQEQLSSSVTDTPTVVVVIQAATWAFVNLLKGDVTGSGWDYVCQQQQQAGGGGGVLWNPVLASRLVTLSVPVIQSSSRQLEKSYIDVSVQSAWILAHVSQREDSVVDALLVTNTNTTNNNNNPDLVRDILERLYQVCEGAAQQVAGGPLSPDRPNYFHHPLIEPCLEVLGHWATGCNGRYVPRLLSPTPPTSRVPRELALIPILEQLLQWGQQGLLLISDYQQLLWLCGCLLCDAGIPNHPSTTYAAPSLMGLVTKGLHDNPNALNARINSLECKRYGVLALCNALDTPPSLSEDDDDEMDQPQQSQSHVPSGEMLLSMLQLILRAGDDDHNKTGYSTIISLKNLLLCQDVDAMLASLRILDAILRNVPSTRTTFVEADGDQALETVCDLPLGNDRASNEAADLAADLIDDFLDDENDDGGGNDQFADPVLQPATAGGTFVFGLQNTAVAAPAPIFLPDLQQWDSSSTNSGTNIMAPPPPGTGLAPSVPSACGDHPGGIGLGRGRGRGSGRGHSVPAWAVQQQQQAHR